ncbi:vWA domain-containing protein [Massilia brevitalea]|uniref:vWA domain-containing protein n=1 Tax=Massilia brevitalea TaxID=442526 RepID=UPI002739C22C|nr:vWA domain-containing protein [Massilia brevitalea]
MHPPYQRQRGAVLIMVVLAMLVLLALVGLVVDGGLAYLVKARLNAAVDAAALAGARAVPAGKNQTEQTASAKTAAATFFAANIPENYLMSRPALLSTDVSFDKGQVTVDVHAEAPMPVSVMQLMGFTALNPVAYAQTIRKDLDMAFVVDTSGSLSGSAAAVRASAKSFLNKFNVTQDRVGLIHFASGAEVDNPIDAEGRGFDRSAMLANIDGFQFNGNTASVEGMWHARNELNKIPLLARSSLRVIVFFSDGAPTAFGSALKFNNPADCPRPGVLAHNDAAPSGLYALDRENTSIGGGCNAVSNNKIKTTVKGLPDWYDAHDNKKEFPIVTAGPREVTASLASDTEAWRNITRAARNLPEAVAARARDEGIYVFTLGMGQLKSKTGFDKEVGENVLKCMANVADAPARCYDPDKPVGMYCYAATGADLTPCFSRLASAILRISK